MTLIAPTTVLAVSNLKDSSLNNPATDISDIVDSPNSPDADWWTAVNASTVTSMRLGFPTPASAPVGVQTFRVRARKTAGSETPMLTISLYEAGALVRELLTEEPITSLTGQIVEATWNASKLVTPSGADVEIVLTSTQTGGAFIQPYGPDAEWNIPIAVAAARGTNPYSAYFAARLFAAGTTNWMNFFNREFSYPVYDVSDATITATLVKDFGNAGSTIPWNPAWQIPTGTDAQVIIIDPSDGREWNIYQASFAGSTLTVTRANIIQNNVDGTGGQADYRTKENGYRASRGVGIQYFAMLIRPAEITQGKIYHALSMPHLHPGYHLFADPGTKGEGFAGNEDNLGIPQGSRFYINKTEAEIDAFITTWPGGVTAETRTTMKIVFMAMVEYGVVITDNSGSNHLQFELEETADWAPLGMAEYTVSSKVWPRDAMDGFITSASQIIFVPPPDEVYFHAESGSTVEPIVLSSPVISGSGTLSLATDALFIGEATISPVRNWQKDTGGGFSDVSGATGTTFNAAAEGAANYRLRVTATNSHGSTNAFSNTITEAGAGYSVTWVTADGTNDYLYDGAGPVGADGTSITIAFLVRDTNAQNGDAMQIFSIWGRGDVNFTTGNLLQVRFNNTANVNIVTWTSTASVRAAGESLFVITLDTSSTPTITVTRNGSAVAGSFSTQTAGTLDLTRTAYGFACLMPNATPPPTAGSLWVGDIGYIYVAFNESHVHADFFSGSYLNPAGVGTPEFVFHGAASVWNAGTNAGNAGNVTAAGAFV